MAKSTEVQLAEIGLLLDQLQYGGRSEKLAPERRERYRGLLNEAKLCIGAARDILGQEDSP